MEIVVKYCGGCNCQIDRSKIIREIESLLKTGRRLTTDSAGEPFPAGVLICGCPTACARKPELGGLARSWVVIAGKTVNDCELSEEKIAATVAQILNEIDDSGKK